MPNKKAGIPIGEVVGFLTVIFVMALFLLIFGGCVVSSQEKKFEQFQFSREEIYLMRDLNNILEKPVGGDRTVSNLIIEPIQELYTTNGDLTAAREDIGNVAREYFAGYRRFMIFNDVGGFLYDSRGSYAWREYGDEVPEGTAILAVPLGENKFAFVEAALQ